MITAPESVLRFDEARLDNGLRIIGEFNPGASSVAVGYFVQTGARDETPEISGVSHFLEHMVFKGNDEFTAEENKWLVFNEKEAQTPIGQRCKTTDPATGVERTGCVINVTIRPPPGNDFALVSATPDSSVVVLNPA